jgi:hypothetical protein
MAMHWQFVELSLDKAI